MAKIKACIIAILCFAAFLRPAQPGDLSQCREDVRQTYHSQIGVKEEGHNRGEEVVDYLNSTGLDGGYAWCAAFVNWCLEQHAIQTPDKAAWSPSWFPDAKTAFQRGDTEFYYPKAGDVFGIYFSSKERIAHVGFIDEWQSGKFTVTVEGNTNKAGSREGDGVYKKRRLKRQIYKVANWIDRDRRISYAIPIQPGKIQCPFHNYLIKESKRA